MQPNQSSVTTTLLSLGVITLFSFFTCNYEKPELKYAEAPVNGTTLETEVSGMLRFYELNDRKVKMDLIVKVPSKANSSVAVHLHEHGDCGNSGADAHGHWNPTNKPHGKWGVGQHHSGDIGNITLDEKGIGKLTVVTSLWTIGGPDSTNIVNRGVIVHAGVDDYQSQPAGNSGARIGCGVVIRK